MPFEVGDVPLVRFPFTDQVGTKQRPAVVLSSRAYTASRPDVIIGAITSQFRPTQSIGEVRLVDWQTAGLLKPSTFKPVLATVELRLVLRRLGVISARDKVAIGQALATVLGLPGINA